MFVFFFLLKMFFSCQSTFYHCFIFRLPRLTCAMILYAYVFCMIQMEEFHSPGLKNVSECRSIQQKAQEEVMRTSKLLEDNEKRLEALQDCQGKLRIEEQQVQSHIEEMTLKINTLTDEREAVNEQKVCCVSHVC